MSETRTPIKSLSLEEIEVRLRAAGEPAYRGKQVTDWIYGKRVNAFDGMSNLPAALRKTLGEEFVFDRLEPIRVLGSEDTTRKYLFRLADGALIESVLIPASPALYGEASDRRTLCISTQVGCAYGCKFCASGLDGWSRNLGAGEIVDQILRVEEHSGERISNIVFMGMGEPLANYANVLQAIRVLHDPKGLNISARKITLSTVGVPKRMRELAEEELPLNLAISLHAPSEQLRRQLIPWAEHFSIDEILDAATYYFHKTGREITFEYILLSGVNDRPEHAHQLAAVCRSMRANVNLLRYNEVESLPYKRPQGDAVMQFQSILRSAGVNAHVRKSRGRDIAAACGQLRRRENQASEQLVQIGQ